MADVQTYLILTGFILAGIYIFWVVAVIVGQKALVRYPIYPAAVKIDPNVHGLDVFAMEYITKTSEELARLGFSPDSHYWAPDYRPYLSFRQIVFRNERDQVRAVINLLLVGTRLACNGTILFSSIVSNDVDLETSNATDLTFAELNHRVNLRLPRAKIDELFETHVLAFDRLTNRKRFPLPPPEAYRDELNAELVEWFDLMETQGYLFRIDGSREFRLTWRGAFVSGFMGIEPFRSLKLRRCRRETTRTLARLGIMS